MQRVIPELNNEDGKETKLFSAIFVEIAGIFPYPIIHTLFQAVSLSCYAYAK